MEIVDLTTEDILRSISKPKLPMQPLGMPGPSSALGLAQTTTKAVPEYLKDIYSRIHRAVTQGPYSSPTGEYDPSIGTLPFEIMMPGYGRAIGLKNLSNSSKKVTELGAFGGRRKDIATPNMRPEEVNYAPSRHGFDKNKSGFSFVETHPPHPDYPNDPRRYEIVYRDKEGNVKGSLVFATDKDKNIINKNLYGEPEDITMFVSPEHRDKGVALELLRLAKQNGINVSEKTLQGMNYTQAGADLINGLSPLIAKKGGGEFELGAFGGQGRLKTNSPGEAIGRLQEQLPVTKQWIEEWAKDTGVNITTETTKKTASGHKVKRPTHYMTLEDPANPGNTALVRVPTDPARHAGYAKKNKAGQYYDTGLPGIDKQTGTFARTPLEDNLINQGGISYANREAMEQALKWKFSKDRMGGNFLTSPDAAPRVTPMGQPTPPKSFQDPNQLKLLSGGFTPYDILKILEQNNDQK